MKIVVFGATGPTGPQLVTQALERGWDVTAMVRNPAGLPLQSDLLLQKGYDDMKIGEAVTPEHGSQISRADLAAFVLDQVSGAEWVHKTPTLAY